MFLIHTELEKILTNHTYGKELISKTYKELIQLYRKKMFIQALNRHFFQKGIYIWPRDIRKDAQHHWSSVKCKSRPQWDITSYLLGWLLPKRQEITNYGKDAKISHVSEHPKGQNFCFREIPHPGFGGDRDPAGANSPKPANHVFGMWIEVESIGVIIKLSQRKKKKWPAPCASIPTVVCHERAHAAYLAGTLIAQSSGDQ